MHELHIIGGPLKGKCFTVKGRNIFVGRSKRNDIRIRDGSVSGRHLKLTRNNGAYLLEDLKSLNGTFINGNRISPGSVTSFQEGDQIRLGRTVLTLRNGAQTATQRPRSHLGNGWNGEERRRNERKDVAFIIDTAQLLAGKTPSIQETLDQVLNGLLSFLEAFDRAFVFIFLPDQHIVKTIAMCSKLERNDTTVQYSQTVVEQVIQQGQTICISAADTEATQKLTLVKPTQILSIACAPLFKGSKSRGALYLDALRIRHDIQRKDTVILESVCDLLSSYFQKLHF